MEKSAKISFADRLRNLLDRYGGVAFAVYFAIFGLVFAGFFVAIRKGVAVEGAAGSATTVGAAWLATKVTQPLRIAATLLLTPLVAAVLERARLRKPLGKTDGTQADGA